MREPYMYLKYHCIVVDRCEVSFLKLLLTHIIYGMLKVVKVGWRRDNVESTSVEFVHKLSQVLWYLDAHHEKFSSRTIQIPDHFSQFHGYNDFKRKKEKEPQLSASSLEEH